MSFKDLPDPQNKILPYVLSISFSDKSTLSDEDAKKIRKKLGLSTNEISKNCYLAPRGLMNTDKGTYSFGYGLSHISNVQYAGTINEYHLRARALCKVGPTVPGNAGSLIMLNDRIQVTLKKVNCPLPTRAVKGLVVTYTGTKKSTCEYQY
ncbi:MAG: hypothetical protein PHW76_01435 [Alphaproteobacteria bacterium]|nr:hypothetical protein [Alphaproteobacteria bacterium]